MQRHIYNASMNAFSLELNKPAKVSAPVIFISCKELFKHKNWRLLSGSSNSHDTQRAPTPSCTHSATFWSSGTDTSWTQKRRFAILLRTMRDPQSWSRRPLWISCFSASPRKIPMLPLIELSWSHQAAHLEWSSERNNPKSSDTSSTNRSGGANRRARVYLRPLGRDVRARFCRTRSRDTSKLRDLRVGSKENKLVGVRIADFLWQFLISLTFRTLSLFYQNITLNMTWNSDLLSHKIKPVSVI